MRVIREFFKVLQKDLRIHIDGISLSYIRLMNHIKFLLLRLNNEEELQEWISQAFQRKSSRLHNQAKILCNDLAKVLHKDLPDSELGYLALHFRKDSFFHNFLTSITEKNHIFIDSGFRLC